MMGDRDTVVQFLADGAAQNVGRAAGRKRPIGIGRLG